jgi:hypothetical protein
MTTLYQDVLTQEQLNYLNERPEVIQAKASLDARTSGMVYFSVPVTEVIRDTLQRRFGLDIPINAQLPMRWIKGDIAPHTDVGSTEFNNTYLLYLNDSPGELIIDSQSYPIQNNTGVVFNEGLHHETKNTNHIPRLLIGPMNELIQPVGATTYIIYYESESDALTNTNSIGYSIDYTVNGPLGYSSWRIASNSAGTSAQNIIYRNGDLLISDGFYNLYPTRPCFLEGTTLLCQVNNVDTYVPIEQLKKGMLVKTSLDGYKAVCLLGKGTIHNPGTDERTENRLYKCSTRKYPSLISDLYITGCHSILEFPITEKQTKDIKKHAGRLYVTDKKYRLMACLDERAEPWNSQGEYTIWHVALEHNDETMNYGVFANGGLLVETCSIHFLKNRSNMVVE